MDKLLLRGYDAPVIGHNAPATDLGHDGASTAARRDWRRRLPFFYGWVIAGATFVALGLTYTVWYSFSVFYVALLAEFGWSRASSAGVFSLFVMMAALGGAGAGTLTDRFGPGRVTSVGVVILAGALVACSRIGSLLEFYLCFGILAAIGVSTTGWIPCVTLVSRWFAARLGVALGIASAGIGFGILVMVPVTQMVIEHAGWRVAYQVLAATVLIGVAPMALILMRGRPEDLGLLRDGRRPQVDQREGAQDAPKARQLRVVDPKWANYPWTVATALLTRRYWAIAVMLFLNNVATQMIFVHQVAFLVDGGYGPLLAATIVGLIGLISVGAKIGWGWVSDRLGRELTWSIGLGFVALGITILIGTRLVTLPPLLYIFALAFALGYGASAPLAPAVVADIFSGRRFGSIYGTVAIGNGLGSASGAWFAGYVFDLTGSYLPAFALGAASALISVVAVWVAAPRKVRSPRRL